MPEKDRDEDLENTLGNLMIANYQVMRLEEKLRGKVSIIPVKNSSFTFKRSGEWYKVTVGIERQQKGKEEYEAEMKKDPNPNNENVVVPLPNAPVTIASTPNISGMITLPGGYVIRDDFIIQ